jgi:hypothetical protein
MRSRHARATASQFVLPAEMASTISVAVSSLRRVAGALSVIAFIAWRPKV